MIEDCYTEYLRVLKPWQHVINGRHYVDAALQHGVQVHILRSKHILRSPFGLFTTSKAETHGVKAVAGSIYTLLAQKVEFFLDSVLDVYCQAA